MQDSSNFKIYLNPPDPFTSWFDALEKRHMAHLTFPEIRHGVQALSSLYVERRSQIGTGTALTGAGKKAAFAMFYGPLHFLLVREIVRSLHTNVPTSVPAILDLGCGTGIAGAAWALETVPRARVVGVERNPWAASECRWTYHALGIQGTVRAADIEKLRIPRDSAIIAAFTMNELDEAVRDRLLREFLRGSGQGGPVLIIEPIARRLVRWWDDWAGQWVAAGGREDSWRFKVELPKRLALMDRAAGLDHKELTARSLWLPGRP